MNILQVHKFFWKRDGASNYFFSLSEGLQKKGHTVVPFSMMHPNNESSPYSKWFVSQLDLDQPSSVSIAKKIRSAGRMMYSLEAKRKITQLLSQEKVDVVHLHNIYHHISPSILPVIKKQGIPIVMTLHDYKLISPNYSLFHHGAVHEEDGEGWYVSCVKNKCMKDSRLQSVVVTAEMIFHHKIMRYYERLVDRFISPSEFLIDLCVKHGWPRSRFVHLPNPIDHHIFMPTFPDEGYVLYAGRLSEEKGLHVLLDAARQTPDIPYVLVGTGPMVGDIERRITVEKIHNVTCRGFLQGEKLQGVLRGARLMVLPAIWYENYPLSVLEAKAMGKVVIASNIGGLPEILPADLLCPVGDAKRLAGRIRSWYYMSPSVRTERGKELCRDTQATNDPEAHLNALVGLYQEL